MTSDSRPAADHSSDPGFSTRGSYVTGGEEFTRDTNYIEDRITRDGEPGRNGEPGWPAEAGRYRLIAARACPWANRTVIVRRLLGLEDAISLGQPGPTHDARSWTFDLDPGGVDTVLGIERIRDAYFRRFPAIPGESPYPRSSTYGQAAWSPTISRRSRWTSPRSGRRSTGPVLLSSILPTSGRRSTK